MNNFHTATSELPCLLAVAITCLRQHGAALLMGVILFFLFATAHAGSHSLTGLRGEDFKLGAKTGDILTYEYGNRGAWGDVFLFVDYVEDDDGHDWYAEISPRYRLATIQQEQKNPFDILAIYIAGNFERGHNDRPNVAITTVESNLLGLGVDLQMPGFRFFKLNAYYRDTRTEFPTNGAQVRAGSTYQVTLSAAAPFQIAEQSFLIDGFIDYAGEEGAAKAWLLSAIQAKWDVGKSLFSQTNRLFVGVEQQIWRNKLGRDGVNENVTQLLLKVHF